MSIRKKKNPSGKRQKVHILKDIIVLLEKKMKRPILKNASESTESPGSFSGSTSVRNATTLLCLTPQLVRKYTRKKINRKYHIPVCKETSDTRQTQGRWARAKERRIQPPAEVRDRTGEDLMGETTPGRNQKSPYVAGISQRVVSEGTAGFSC